MMSSMRGRIATLVLLFGGGVALGDPGDYPKRAPFEAVRWKGDTPELSIDGKWYELVSIDGVGSDRVLQFCKTTYERRAQKRFAEDLHEVLSRMGHPPGETVKLEVRPVGGGAVVVMPKVTMTEAKRRAVMKSQEGVRPILVRRKVGQVISRDEALADLKSLERALSERYSYLTLRSFDWRAKLEEIRRDLPERVKRADLAVQIMKLLAPFGDGHTRVHEGEAFLPSGYLPFLVGQADGGLVAFKEDRSGFVDVEHPFVKSIDGIAIDGWLKATECVVAHGAPEYRRFHGLGMLRYVAFLREQLKLPAGKLLRVELTAKDGSTVTREMKLSDKRPRFGQWPRMKTGPLQGNIGYLRLARMDDDAKFLDGLDEAMDRFRNTRGLIVDVRGNGGGSRDVLRRLYPYFAAADAEPCVVNVARYRLGPGETNDSVSGHLSDRFLYPTEWHGWSKPQREAIARFAKTFQPKWNATGGQFSDLHYMVLDRSSSAKAYHYDKPVVVLIDTGCFSATDVFASAMKGRANITLMGTCTGGGSGRVKPIELPASGLRIMASTMVSYRSDGSLYDGEGIEPDLTMQPAAADYLKGHDSVLDAARDRIESAAPAKQ